VVIVNAIPEKYKNYVNVTGAVDIPGNYSVGKNSRISDVIKRVNLLDDALTELTYVKRLNPDGKTIQYIPINLQSVIENSNSNDNIVLNNRDELVIYKRSKFVDAAEFTVVGAVRDPGKYRFDHSRKLTLNDAIFFSGGLKEDATDFAYIQRKNLERPNQSEYIRIDLNDSQQVKNLELLAEDQVIFYSKLDFIEKMTISIGGAVQQEGTFAYDESITIKDLIVLAGGLKFNAAKKRVDVFRLKFDDDKKTSVLAANLEIDENNEILGSDYVIQPFDKIFIRQAPEFEEQSMVNIAGEVKWPGSYALIDENEKISSLISRAGGLTEEAFASGASLFRFESKTGFVVFDLNDAMENPSGTNNVILSRLDQIKIPKKKVLVSLEGELKFHELYANNVNRYAGSDTLYQNKIAAPFEPGKNAKYYIDKYGGGIGKNGKKSLVSVRYANGRIAKSNRFLFWHRYPEVRPGSKIRVSAEEKEQATFTGEENDTDWGQVFSDSIAQVTAILSLLLLVQRID